MIYPIYPEALRVMKPEQIDHHETDLYLLVTPESAALVKGYAFKKQVTTFRSHKDGKVWYDIPFAYLPNWKGAAK